MRTVAERLQGRPNASGSRKGKTGTATATLVSHPIAQRVAAIANGASMLRVIQVEGRTDDELLADVLGPAYLPPA